LNAPVLKGQKGVFIFKRMSFLERAWFERAERRVYIQTGRVDLASKETDSRGRTVAEG